MNSDTQETTDIPVTATAADVKTILQTAFGGEIYVAMHLSSDVAKTNAKTYTVAFGDGHPGNIEIIHVDSTSMTLGTVYVTELAPGALRHTESNVIEGRAYRFKITFDSV